jgi:hypothetical protein
MRLRKRTRCRGIGSHAAKLRGPVTAGLPPFVALDAKGKALLEVDLRSPCTGEIFVVLDTAPTGHTILLLDSALAYHREVSRQASGIPPEVELLLPRA